MQRAFLPHGTPAWHGTAESTGEMQNAQTVVDLHIKPDQDLWLAGRGVSSVSSSPRITAASDIIAPVMLADSDLEALLGSRESDRTERRPSLSQRTEICQNICAFANDLPGHGTPGVVFVGVDDAGGPSGLSITDEVLRTLADLRSNGNIYPFPTMVVDARRLKGAEVAVVIVEPSGSPPVRFRGRTYVKVGPKCRIATPEEERRLAERRRAANVPFDAMPVVGAALDDIDLARFRDEYLPAVVSRDVLDQNRRSVGDQLASLRLSTPDGIPTVAGILAIGGHPRAHLPGSHLERSAFRRSRHRVEAT